jgi:hypothetical protein
MRTPFKYSPRHPLNHLPLYKMNVGNELARIEKTFREKIRLTKINR